MASVLSPAPSTVSLYRDYRSLIDPATQRARVLKKNELLLPDHMQADHQEACSVAKFYLTALKLATKAFQEGALDLFDGTIGDNACQVVAAVVITAYQDPSIHEEVARLHTAATAALKRLQIFTNKTQLLGRPTTAPFALIEQEELDIPLSERMDYLLRAFILHAGTIREQRENGDLSLKVLPEPLKIAFSKQISTELIIRIITATKERLNQDSIEAVQAFASSSLDPSETDALAEQMVKLYVTPRKERLRFCCPFFSVKATLCMLALSKIPFMVVPCARKKTTDGSVFFQVDPDDHSSIPRMRLISSEGIPLNTPIFVIEAKFNEALERDALMRAIEEHGLLPYTLANIAAYPQFPSEAAYAADSELFALPQDHRDEDLVTLPPELGKEVLKYRAQGRSMKCTTAAPKFMNIIHTYARVHEPTRV